MPAKDDAPDEFASYCVPVFCEPAFRFSADSPFEDDPDEDDDNAEPEGHSHVSTVMKVSATASDLLTQSETAETRYDLLTCSPALGFGIKPNHRFDKNKS